MGWGKLVEDFKQKGNITAENFEWLFFNDEELKEIVNESFEMYRYHLRRIDGNENLGWLRIMYHSLIQQAVRTDLRYWLLYSVLREEHTMVSYPYYTKYTVPGDKTFFRHVDLNLSVAHAQGLGADMIQGSVSIDDENSQNCTEVLEGFHRHVGPYLQWRKTAKKDPSGLIEGWKDNVDWTQEAQATAPGVKWAKSICGEGDIRITHPMTPHGSTGPATTTRRTILPWYVMVRQGVMENPAMGTYDEISKAHRDLTAPPASPSGHRNKYGGIKWAFPADVHIDFSSWIQKAILAQVSWDNPLVRKEIHDLLSKDEDGILEHIRKEREYVVEEIKTLWPVVKELEKAAFAKSADGKYPDVSFFTNKGKPPAREGQWHVWDHDYSTGDAVGRLIDEIDMEPDVRYYFRNAANLDTMPTPSSPFKTPRARAGSLASSLSSPPSSLRSPTTSPPPVPPLPPQFKIPTPAPSAPAAGPSEPRRSGRNVK